MNIENNYGNVSNLFVRLIGYINLILQFDSYKENYSDYNEIVQTSLMKIGFGVRALLNSDGFNGF